MSIVLSKTVKTAKSLLNLSQAKYKKVESNYSRYNQNLFILILVSGILSVFGCQVEKTEINEIPTKFKNIPITESNIKFRNEVIENNVFNFFNYIYIYNGGGVAIGDINNDGLKDIYFSSNQGSNKLYLNKGKLKFEDVTKEFGVEDNMGWSTGVSMIDINNDGWLDIYVCKSAMMNNQELRKNKLYINQEGKSFKEMGAQYGLDDPAYSTQAYFFDYDNDLDLDMYLVNHRVDFTNTIRYNTNTQHIIEPFASDKLYRNDGQRFTDVSNASGVENKTWGLSAAIQDFNNDGWLDIYVCNDFIYGDQLMINDQNGGFKNEIHTIFDHTPFFSMGSDVADINNDSKMDLMVVDMISEDHVSNKRLMAGMSTPQFNLLVELGNHYQYMTNVMQLNRGNGAYSDIAYASGVANTDWSWAPLLADFNNDGLKDLFITNGIKRDMTDNDFKSALEERAAQGPINIEELFDIIPSRKVKNYLFENQGSTQFKNVTTDWGLTEHINSNGASYGDLDNDGDLDIVLNNLGDYASLYENLTNKSYLKVKLNGPPANKSGLGTILELEGPNGTQYHQHFLNRGYQSSVADEIIFGLSTSTEPVSLKVQWPDGKTETIEGIKTPNTLIVEYGNASSNAEKEHIDNNQSFVGNKQLSDKVNYTHTENKFDDFSREILLPQKYSSLGPYSSIADVDGNGFDDIFISGSKDMPALLMLQKANGEFVNSSSNTWEDDKSFEDLGSVFIDGDLDGDLDLYVVSGGNESSENSDQLLDRYYINDGKGNFSNSPVSIPSIKSSGYKVIKADYDNDGDEDLFVAGRIVPGKYPLPASSNILRNDNGRFVNVSNQVAKGLSEIGLVTDAIFSDYDNDKDLDLLIVGEWMGLTIFVNDNNSFTKKEYANISGKGWWYSINSGDFNNDNKPDFVLGNLGLNNKFGAKKDKIFHVFCNDFDASGNLDIVLSKENNGKLLPVRGRECSSQQMPFIKAKFPNFKSFAESDLEGIYGEDKIKEALHYTVNNFESIVLLSNESGSFDKLSLPITAQYGPILSTIIKDINNDGHLDIIGAGNIYDAEVETVRYDASKGFVLLGDGTGSFKEWDNSGLLLNGDVKQIQLFDYQSQIHLMVVKNSGKLDFIKFD